MPDHIILEIVGMLLSAGAIYGAIRMDIRNIHEKRRSVEVQTKEKLDEMKTTLNTRIEDMMKYSRRSSDIK